MPYPVLYLNDGQNLFGDCPTLSGASWEAAQAAAGLIASGKLPPFLLVGLDHAGPLRSLEYTPYKPGTGPGGFRCGTPAGLAGGACARACSRSSSADAMSARFSAGNWIVCSSSMWLQACIGSD